MRYWDTLLERDQDGFQIVIDKTWEDVHPSDCFDTSIDPDTGLPYYDVAQMCEDIDSGKLDWFVLRARVFAKGVELGSATCGGLLYEDARDSVNDVGEDLVLDALVEGRDRLTYLAREFTMLTIKYSEETV
jgi:hypothetical protein